MVNAIPVPRKDVGIGSWKPKQNDCHKNAVEYVKLTENNYAVYGWLVLDYSSVNIVDIQFIAHSVIKGKNGKLFDITPSTCVIEYPFMASTLSLTDYDEIVDFSSGKIKIFQEFN